MSAQKTKKIKPKYIKNEKGKTTEVYLDLETFHEIIARLTNFKKKLNQK